MAPHPPSPKQAAHAFDRVLVVKTARRTELVDITPDVTKIVNESGVQHGVCRLYVPHTTAGITINESDDPAVARDIEATLERLVPKSGPYQHLEGNADAHIKSTLTGVSETIPIAEGRLALGRWQGVYFCEFDGPRSRQVRVQIVPDAGE
ncbi:MAG TPA: secondary thiamine-phosphate synthase enzyme YjbQ [Candidatus Acidoferrales bacterium]|nr:secondary thiamine-phosphate synthase enzyme YjbQ [Candidatus Acidoferrales bacterium]